MLLNKIDRYILAELTRPFLAGVAAFLIIMISNTLFIYMELIVKSGVDTETVVQLLLYSLPAIVVVTLPVAFMFATLLALGRLAKDSEIIALRACGVSLMRILMPILIASLFISYVGYWLNETVVPWSNRQSVDLAKTMLLKEPFKAIKSKQFLNVDDRNFFVQEVDREKQLLIKVYVIDKSKAGYPQVISAETAKRAQTKWILFNGIVRKINNNGFIDHEIKFETMEIEMDLKADLILSNQRSVRELSGSEAKELIKEKQDKGQDVLRDLVDLHLKIALPLATFFTSLVSSPIGIRFSKMGGYFGVAVSIALVFVWYVMYSIFSNLGYAGTVDPWIAAWVQNIGFGGIGALLLIQMAGVDILYPFKIPMKIFRKFVPLKEDEYGLDIGSSIGLLDTIITSFKLFKNLLAKLALLTLMIDLPAILMCFGAFKLFFPASLDLTLPDEPNPIPSDMPDTSPTDIPVEGGALSTLGLTSDMLPSLFMQLAPVIISLTLIIGVVGLLSMLSTINLSEKGFVKQPIQLIQVVFEAFRAWPNSLWTSLTAIVIVALYSILFFIPGLVFAGFFVLFLPAVMLRQLSGRKALDYSKQLVKGQWFKIMMILFVSSLICNMIVLVVQGIIAIFPQLMSMPIIVLSGLLVSLFIMKYNFVILTIIFLKSEGIQVQSQIQR